MREETPYRIRPLTSADQSLLWEMLYLSLYVPDGARPFDRDILHDPDIARYAADWGRDGDTGFVADAVDGQTLGAVWLRLFSEEEKGFGYVDGSTPELGIAVVPGHRHGNRVPTSGRPSKTKA